MTTVVSAIFMMIELKIWGLPITVEWKPLAKYGLVYLIYWSSVCYITSITLQASVKDADRITKNTSMILGS